MSGAHASAALFCQFSCQVLRLFCLIEHAVGAGLQQDQQAIVEGVGSGVIIGSGPGVLEIKCPFNRGDPLTAAPPRLPQWYYMPQVMTAVPMTITALCPPCLLLNSTYLVHIWFLNQCPLMQLVGCGLSSGSGHPVMCALCDLVLL